MGGDLPWDGTWEHGILLCRVGPAGAVAGEGRSNSDSATNIRGGDESGTDNEGVDPA
jgi:hypothetical protein